MSAEQRFPEWRSTPPSYSDCRRAARSIHRAEFGRDAVNLVRPRSVLGLFRGKAPLPLLLYVAGYEGRLVWRNPDSLALLQPPADRAPAALTGGARVRVLRALVRHWDTVLFAAPPLVFLLGAIAVVMARDVLGRTATVVVGICLGLLAMAYVALGMTALVLFALRSLLRAARRPRPTPDAVAAQTLPGTRWSLVLCHQLDPGDAELLGHITAKLRQLITGQAQQFLWNLGAQAPIINVTETLVCLREGITTGRMRRTVANWSTGLEDGEMEPAATFKAPLRQARRPPLRPFDKGGLALLYLVGVTAVVLAESVWVADRERQACAPAGCAGRPATYSMAVRWLAQRLLFNDPPGVSPATAQASVLGWLTSLMSAMAIVVIAVAVRQYVNYRVPIVERNTTVLNGRRAVVLILVATTTERDAVIAAVQAANGREPQQEFPNNQVVFDLGPVSRAQVLLAQSGPGAVGPGGAAITAAALISRLAPDFLILAGICFGLREDEQRRGDVIVSRQLRAIDHRKVTEPKPGRPPITLLRGDFVSSSEALKQRFQASTYNWTGCAVHFGTMLSSSTLVNSRQLRGELRDLDPEAVGGEMEGAGVYAAAAPEKVDWIVVKAIADWGYDKSDDMQPVAARNAADFVVHTLRSGAMDEPVVPASAS